MKKILFTALICSSVILSFGQVLEPASWNFEATNNKVGIGDTIELIFIAELEDTWHLYAVDLDPDIGPLPTSFEFAPHPGYELVGEVIQEDVHQKYDNTWKDTVRYFSEKAVFRQKIRILSETVFVKVFYEYLTCTTVDGMCIPGDGEYVFSEIEVIN